MLYYLSFWPKLLLWSASFVIWIPFQSDNIQQYIQNSKNPFNFNIDRKANAYIYTGFGISIGLIVTKWQLLIFLKHPIYVGLVLVLDFPHSIWFHSEYSNEKSNDDVSITYDAISASHTPNEPFGHWMPFLVRETFKNVLADFVR